MLLARVFAGHLINALILCFFMLDFPDNFLIVYHSLPTGFSIHVQTFALLHRFLLAFPIFLTFVYFSRLLIDSLINSFLDSLLTSGLILCLLRYMPLASRSLLAFHLHFAHIYFDFCLEFSLSVMTWGFTRIFPYLSLALLLAK